MDIRPYPPPHHFICSDWSRGDHVAMFNVQQIYGKKCLNKRALFMGKCHKYSVKINQYEGVCTTVEYSTQFDS